MNGKKIYDPIHGFIPIQPHLLSIIDTQEFQRLRDLKQLGATHYVFPSATHTRFEHSLGVSFLARKLMESLQKNQPSLKITERQIQLVEIAGLIHDLGHGPFSHLWDNYVIFKEEEEEHEERSCVIFSVMISKYNLPITKKETEIICELINPSEENSREWMFQIVANKRCQLDVDKIDYIQRDSLYLGNIGMKGEFDRLITEARVVKTIDDTYELGWFHRLNYEIFSLFTNRYRMHKLVYNHHTVKAYEYLILDILKNFHKRMHQESPIDRVEFLQLTDAIVNCQLHSLHYKHIQYRLYRRQIPKMIGEHIISRHTNPTIYKKISNETYPRRILNMMIDKIDIGFSSGSINPMDEIYYYKKYNSEEEDIPEGIKQKPIWNSKEFSETILRCYHLNPDNYFESDKSTYELEKAKNENNWNMYLKELYSN